jgi:DnaJ family protein C protein 7
MAAARDESMRSSMEIDRDTSSSPQDTPPASQAEGAPTNTTGVQNGDGESSPAPPPHRSSPPRSQPSDAGESFKLTGNKFYKAGDYERAIQEYNKG